MFKIDEVIKKYREADMECELAVLSHLCQEKFINEEMERNIVGIVDSVMEIKDIELNLDRTSEERMPNQLDITKQFLQNVLGEIFHASDNGNAYAQKWILEIYKKYHRKEYSILKRFKVLEGEAIFHFSESENLCD